MTLKEERAEGEAEGLVQLCLARLGGLDVRGANLPEAFGHTKSETETETAMNHEVNG